MNATLRIQALLEAKRAKAELRALRSELVATNRAAAKSLQNVQTAYSKAARARSDLAARQAKQQEQLEAQRARNSQRLAAQETENRRKLSAKTLQDQQKIHAQRRQLDQKLAQSQESFVQRFEKRRLDYQEARQRRAEQSAERHAQSMANAQKKSVLSLRGQGDRQASTLKAQEDRQTARLAAQVTKLGQSLGKQTAAQQRANQAMSQGVTHTSALSRATASLRSSIDSANARLSAYQARLLAVGKDQQWVGRILMTSLSLPILAVGGYAAKMALDQDKAMTRVRKVYADGALDVNQLDVEMQHLERTFFTLSNMFGIHVEDVTEIGAAWAAAGAAGTDLQKMTRNTIEAMILGDLNPDESVDGLITIMNAYGLTAEGITEANGIIKNSIGETLAIFNAVENSTAASMQDLIKVTQTAGSTARNAGIDQRYLAAMTAALIPTAGNAGEAGNFLKSALFQLMGPTGTAAESIRNLGIDLDSLSWRSKTATQRLEEIAERIQGLNQNQKIQFVRDLANLRQGNRLFVLLNDMASEQSNYKRALEATESPQKLLNSYMKELRELLGSNSQQFQIFTNRIRNTMIEAMIPMLPVINNVMKGIAGLTTWFGNLSPGIQQAIMYTLMFVAALGPVIWLVGNLKIAIAAGLIPAIKAVGGVIATVLGVSLGWVGVIALVVAAVGALAYAFRDELAGAIEWMAAQASQVFAKLLPTFRTLMTGINRIVNAGLTFLPQSFHSAFMAVVQVVKNAALAVYSWLSWMNPFARHSPSLVEQVEGGTQVIAQAYDRVAKRVGASMAKVESVMRRFTASIARAKKEAQDAETQQNLEFAVMAGANPDEFMFLVRTVREMESELESLRSEIDGQERSVGQWQKQLDAATESVDAASDKLSKLKDVVSELDDQISGSQSRLQDWLSTPVTGTYAFEDAIFSNSQAQSRLQLEINKLTAYILDQGYAVDEVRTYMDEHADSLDDLADATDNANRSLLESGLSADETRNRMARLRGEIETLRGEELDLRLQGAGSDVLAGLRSQIDQSENIRRGLAESLRDGDKLAPPADVRDAVTEIDRLQEALERLQLDGERLNLEQALALGPAQKAIEDTQRVAERTFDVIIAGISEETARSAALNFEREKAVAAVEAQEVVVNSLTAAREAIQKTYDAEVDKLNDLQDAYSSVEGSIKRIQDEISLAVELGEEMQRALDEAGAGAGGGGLGGPGDFDVPGGGGFNSADYLPEDMAALVDQWQSELEAQFGQFDPLGWVGDKLTAFGDWVADWFSNLMPSSFGSGDFDIEEFLLRPWRNLFGDSFIDGLINPFKEHVWSQIENLVAGVGERLGPLREAFGNLWAAISPLVMPFINNTVTALTWLYNFIVENSDSIKATFETALNGIAQIFSSVWTTIMQMVGIVIQGISNIIQGGMTFITGVINVFAALLTGDWRLLWTGLQQIAQGFLQVLYGLFQATFGALLTYLFGIFTAMWTAARVAWDSIGYPAFMSIMNWIGTVVVGKFMSAKQQIADAWNALPAALSSAMNRVASSVASPINRVIGIINTLTGGINSIARSLGLGFRIGTIGSVSWGGGGGGGGAGVSRLAKGGLIPHQEVDGGFVVNQARAIVGEGNTRHPEFVIPTDPKHRNRAVGLFSDLAQSLGLAPAMARGGKVPALATGGILSSANVLNTWRNVKNRATSSMAGVGGFAGQMGRAAVNQIVSQAGTKISQWIAGYAVKQVRNVFSMFSSARSLLGRGASFLGGGLFAQGGTLPVSPHIYAMANGAYVKGGQGGVLAHIGEGRRDELVLPIDSRVNGLTGGREIHFHGDLSFPNITDGGDAKELIDNLEALV